MKRPHFNLLPQIAALFASGASLALLAGAAHAQQVVLKVHHFLPSTSSA